ncbi:hypothetical protein RQP46_001289 [Phenoliferia psychrophenolica]
MDFIPPIHTVALDVTVALALGIALRLFLSLHAIVGLCNAVTLAFGAWEISSLVDLTHLKASVEGRRFLWGLLLLKTFEHVMITICTLYPVYEQRTVTWPHFLVYNWVYPQLSKVRIWLGVALSAAFVSRNLYTQAHARITVTRGYYENPAYVPPQTLTPTYTVWREAFPLSALAAAPTCPLAALDLFPRDGDNSTASPNTSFPTLHHTLDEDESKHQTADDASDQPEYLSDEPYEAYNSIGGAGSLDPPLLEGYVNYWIEHWKIALFGDLVFAYVVYRSISFLRDDTDAPESGVERVHKGVNCLFSLKVSLSYITSSPMVGPPRQTFPLLDIITSLTEFIPKTAKESFLRPRVALLHLLVCWMTRLIVLRELDRDLTKEDLENTVAVEMKRAVEMKESEKEKGATVGMPAEL